MNQLKIKKCAVCKKEYQPFSSLTRVCGVECAIEFNRKKEKEKFDKQTKVMKKTLIKNDLSHQLKLTQKVFNKLRVLQEFKWFKDNNQEPTCISCGKPNMDWCCGHFKTRGSQGNLRFDEKNTYLQCNRYCNMGLSGNINGNKATRGYVVGLNQRFGFAKAKEIIDYCETHTESKKWTCQELIEMRKEFNKEIRELEKMR